MPRLFHATTRDNAAVILRDGFRDGPPQLAANVGGVWLATYPVDENEGAHSGDVHVVVEIPERELADYEWLEKGMPNRVFVVPAAIVNRHPLWLAEERDYEQARAERDAWLERPRRAEPTP